MSEVLTNSEAYNMLKYWGTILIQFVILLYVIASLNLIGKECKLSRD